MQGFIEVLGGWCIVALFLVLPSAIFYISKWLGKK
jgi:hypothetical protein